MTGYSASPESTDSTSPLSKHEDAARDPGRSAIERLRALADYLTISIDLCQKQYPGDPFSQRLYADGYGAAHGNAKALLDDILRDVPPNIVQDGEPIPQASSQLRLLIQARDALEKAEEFCVEPPPARHSGLFLAAPSRPVPMARTRADELRIEADKLDRQEVAAKMVREVCRQLQVHCGTHAREEE